jgi:hypothetical protein
VLVDHGLTTVGHVMSLLAYDPAKLRERAALGDDAFAQVQEQTATTKFPRTAEELAERLGQPAPAEQVEAAALTETDAEVVAAVAETAEAPAEEVAVEPEEPEAEIVALYEEPPEEIRLPDEEEPEIEPAAEPEPAVEHEPVKKPVTPVIMPARREEDEEKEREPKKRKKGRKKSQHLVYDEDMGEVISKHKGRRGRQDDFLSYDKWEE